MNKFTCVIFLLISIVGCQKKDTFRSSAEIIYNFTGFESEGMGETYIKIKKERISTLLNK